MKVQDIVADYHRGLEAGRRLRARLSEAEIRAEIAEAKSQIKRARTDYEVGPFLVGYRDGLEGA